MRSLWVHWQAVSEELASRPSILLLLDFDGTLAPIEDAPALARMPVSTRTLIRKLPDRCGVAVAIVSGRSVRNIRSRVGLRSIYYAGNHGLEIEGPGLSFRHPLADALQPAIQDAGRTVKRSLRNLPGVFLENKGMTLSLHYRRLPSDRLGDLRQLERTLRAKVRGLPVRWRNGHKVWELIPRADWDKGKAALFLLNHLGRPFPVAVGDDATDEDMFRTLRRRGLTIRIGRAQASRAVYRLSSQAETERLLGALASLLEAHHRC